MHPAFSATGGTGVPIWFVSDATWPALRQAFDASIRGFADASGFEPKPGHCLLLPGGGGLSGVLFGLDPPGKVPADRFLPGRLPSLLPAGTYRFGNAAPDPRLAALAFALGCYRFARYRQADGGDAKEVRLEPPEEVDAADLSRMAEAVALARDLVNTPANDLGPAELEAAVRALAGRHGAAVRSIVGEALLAENFPLIHAVGRASCHPPRLIDL